MKYKKSREATRLESNGDGGSQKGGGDVPPSIQLDIMEHRAAAAAAGGGGLGTGGPGSASFFEPWPEPTPGSGSGHGSSGRAGGREPPEKRLTLFALRLAVLEKAASGLGKLDFVWATVVLLGGFASSLSITDFWCITVILVGEGARVFIRSHELEWQHHATQTSTAGGALRSSSRFFRHIMRAIVDQVTAAATVKRALKVVKMLVSTTGNTGKALRESVAENVFTVSNLRDILRYGQQHRELQKLAMDVLTGLAMDDSGKEAIVATGGVIKLLLSIFFNSQETDLGCEAGEALAMLALESEAGCAAILKRADVMDQLVSALQDGDARRLNAARVLRNLCAYSGQQQRERLRVVTRALPAVLKATMVDRDKILEVSVGLTTEIWKFIDGEQFAAELRRAGVEDERAYVERLASILRQYRYPEIRVPRMRRFVVQQVIWLMTNSGGRGDDGGGYVELLREVGMQRLLESIADTTSELECYHVFSGSVGISKHRESFSAIVDSALELIAGRRQR